MRLLFSYNEHFYHSEEIVRRGYLNSVVQIEQNYYEVVFYSYEEIEFEMRNGYTIAESGMIVIQKLTKESMEKSIKDLYDNSIFSMDLNNGRKKNIATTRRQIFEK